MTKQENHPPKPLIVKICQVGILGGLLAMIIHLVLDFIALLIGEPHDQWLFNIVVVLLCILDIYNFKLFNKQESFAKYLNLLVSIVNSLMIAILIEFVMQEDTKCIPLSLVIVYGIMAFWVLRSRKTR